jgi:hypothetical protein
MAYNPIAFLQRMNGQGCEWRGRGLIFADKKSRVAGRRTEQEAIVAGRLFDARNLPLATIAAPLLCFGRVATVSTALIGARHHGSLTKYRLSVSLPRGSLSWVTRPGSFRL